MREVPTFDFKNIDGRRIYYINGKRTDKKTFFDQLARHRHRMREMLKYVDCRLIEAREGLERLSSVEECLSGAVKDLSKRSKILNRSWKKVNKLSWP